MFKNINGDHSVFFSFTFKKGKKYQKNVRTGQK